MSARRAKSSVSPTAATQPKRSVRSIAVTQAPQPNHPALSPAGARSGRIVLVEAGASVPLEVVFSATRNRLVRQAGLSFAERWTTGRAIQRAGDQTIVSKRLFAALADDGAFALTWQEGNSPTAVPVDSLADLHAGATVVLQAPGEIAETALQLAANVVVLSLTTSAEGNKAGLSRMACLERMTEMPLRHRLQAMREPRIPSIRRQIITVPTATAAAVEALSALLVLLAHSPATAADQAKTTDDVTQSCCGLD